MKEELDRKLKELSEWYDDFISGNRLLILVEGSEYLQNILNASAINAHVWSKHRCSIVLSSKKFGLFHIEILLSANYFILLKPFKDFTYTFEKYVETIIGGSFYTHENYRHIDLEGFVGSDLNLLEKMFDEPRTEEMASLIKNVQTTKEEYLLYKTDEFVCNTPVTGIVKNRGTDKLSFSFKDSSVFDNPNDIYSKLNSDMEREFMEEYKEDIKITKRIMKLIKLEEFT